LQEERIAEDVGGRVQSGSGSSWSAKSDVRKMGDLRIEAKFTEKPEYTLKLDELLKLRDEAIKGGLETPIMQVEFAGPGFAGSYKLAVMDFALFHHWYGFSQNKGLHIQECWTAAKQFRLDLPSARAFFAGATSLSALGVIRLVFERNDWKRHYAVIEWDLFTTLHEEYHP
jgi:hypothetical protein